MVSTVTGTLRTDRDAIDLLRACFPGGSITGAPKLAAMRIIDNLEPDWRSVYCGSIGYVGYDGGMNTNIAIRTLLRRGDSIYTWAGGGIVADSDVDAEYQESLDKAAAVLSILEPARPAALG
jgi:para-aminobenzoate synthetase component 1